MNLKPHRRAISALVFVPSFQITLIKVWQQDHQNEDSWWPVSHRHSTSLDRIALGPLSMDAKYDITLAIYLLCNQRWAWSWSLRSHYFNDLILIFKITFFEWSWSWRRSFLNVGYRRVARNSQWGGGGLFWGSGGGTPNRRRPTGVWRRSPQPPEAGGLGALPPALKNFSFFWKNNFILGLFWLKNNAFKTWLRNWQCKHD